MPIEKRKVRIWSELRESIRRCPNAGFVVADAWKKLNDLTLAKTVIGCRFHHQTFLLRLLLLPLRGPNARADSQSWDVCGRILWT